MGHLSVVEHAVLRFTIVAFPTATFWPLMPYSRVHGVSSAYEHMSATSNIRKATETKCYRHVGGKGMMRNYHEGVDGAPPSMPETEVGLLWTGVGPFAVA